jgi:ABC transporter
VTAPRAVIEVEHLHKRYRDTVAVEDVSFTVTQGEIFGIIGPNGAGKTTTVETVEGLRTPDRGTVRVLGLDPWRDRAELRQRVGVQLQQSDLYDRVRVGRALELFASFYRDPADPDRLLEELGLAGKRDTSFDKLSGGQRQRLSRRAPDPARARGPPAGRQGHHQPGGGPAPVHQRGQRQGPPAARVRQARRQRPGRRRGHGLRAGPADPRRQPRLTSAAGGRAWRRGRGRGRPGPACGAGAGSG